MNLPHTATSLVPPAAVGVSGVSLPWWLEYVPPVWQGIIAVLGFVVLVLTIVKLWHEIKVARRKLRDG